jgi:ferrochelatase
MENSSKKNNGEKREEKTGVVLMTYGSATTTENVREYFERIYKGRASEEIIQDFENRYRLVGHSPLVEITKKQATLLQQKLGENFVVEAGMRHSDPTIEHAVAACKNSGATRLVGIILSPQFASFIMEGYRTAFEQAAEKNGFATGSYEIAKPWPTEPHFVELLAKRTKESLARLQEKYGVAMPVIFTTHSLPQRVVADDPQYLEQLTATINAVRAKLDSKTEWYAAYQSAGHTPEEWLKPDLTDIIAQLAEKKVPAAVIVPIQFLTDHLEILYDLDIAAREQCEECGVAYYRIELANTDPLFVEALEALVLKV